MLIMPLWHNNAVPAICACTQMETNVARTHKNKTRNQIMTCRAQMEGEIMLSKYSLHMVICVVKPDRSH